MATRLVIILDQQSADPPIYRVVLRADVPLTRQSLYANAAYVSPFAPVSPDVDPDLASLRNGAVSEKVDQVQMQPGTTLAQVRLELQARQAQYQLAVANEAKWTRYGTFWNGAAWTAAGV